MLFIEYPKCTTCIKAKAFLKSLSVDFVSRNIKEDNPTKEELIKWHKESGLPLKKLFNTSGLLYKELNLKDKLDTMTDEEKYDLLASNGMIVKRPILITSKGVTFGFNEEWLELIKWKKRKSSFFLSFI